MTQEMQDKLFEECAHLLNGRSKAEQVCVLLDEFQKMYERNTMDTMPGNKYYTDILTRIVEQARWALKSRTTTVAADDATSTHYGQTSTDDYIYSDEVSGAKPHRR